MPNPMENEICCICETGKRPEEPSEEEEEQVEKIDLND